MTYQLELPTGYVDGPTKRRLEQLGFRATGKTRRMYEMRHNVVTIDVASLEELKMLLRDHDAVLPAYGPIQVGRQEG